MIFIILFVFSSPPLAVCTPNEPCAAKLRRQQMVDTKNACTSDRNDMISIVPAIISTSASPTDIVSPNPTVIPTAVSSKRPGRLTQKTSTGTEHISIENEILKTFQSADLIRSNHQLQQQPSHTRSDDLTYCTKCGGLTTNDKRTLSKKRYFSLDKERNEKTTNFLQCLAMHRNDASSPNSGCSENVLTNGRKQCSLDGGECGRLSNQPQSQHQHHQQLQPANNKTFLSTARCDRCENGNQMRSDKNALSKKGSTHRSECGTSCTNRQPKDKSIKSSQNSLREPRTSRKNSIFHLGDRDDSMQRSKRVSNGRKQSTRGPFNLHEEQDAETREILLGAAISHSKFDKFPHEIKIPEPVEAVCFVRKFFFLPTLMLLSTL